MRKVKFKITNQERSMFWHNEGYNLLYKEGEITRAPKSSLGIFCFKTKKQAINYITNNTYYFDEDMYTIRRVIPIGRGKVPKKIPYGWPFPSEIYTTPPSGTICYPAVKVLKGVK
jgi:hypothetical protein